MIARGRFVPLSPPSHAPSQPPRTLLHRAACDGREVCDNVKRLDAQGRITFHLCDNWSVHEGLRCGVIVEQVDPAGFVLGFVDNPDLPALARYVRDGLSIGQVFSLVRGPRPVEFVVDLQDFD
jgi:hypothetical protein